MKNIKIFASILALMAMMSFGAQAYTPVTVDDVSGVFDSDTGIAVGIVPPGQNNLTAFPPLNANGGLSIGTSATPPVNGLAVGAGGITIGSSTIMKSTLALGNGAGVGTATFTNAPVSGNPTKWIPINDNGTVRYIPAF